MKVALDLLELRYADLRIDDPMRRARMAESLRAAGQHSPVLVVPGGDDHFILIDGYLRVAALRALTQDEVEALVLDVDEAEALVLAHRLESKRRRSPLEEGWLVAALLDRHGLQMREVAARLSRSVSWVSRRVAMVRALPEVAQQAVKRGQVAAHAAGTFLVPLSRGNTSHCETLVTALGGKAVTTRQVERLYLGYRRTDEEGRERIVAQPWLFLSADEALQSESKLDATDPAAALVNDLEAICGISRRGRRRVREGLLAEADERGLAEIDRQGRIARLASSALFDMLWPKEKRSCSTATRAPRS